MLRVVEAFSGIGAQAKALERLKKKYQYEYSIENTIEWDIYAILAYDLIHNGPRDLRKIEDISDLMVDSFLQSISLSPDGKEPFKNNSIIKLNRNMKRHLYLAIKRTHNLVSIMDVHSKDLPSEIDVLTYSFPCQNLSVASTIHGYMTGIDKSIKNRSGMLWEVERILEERKHDENGSLPKFLLMENVTTLLSRRFKRSFFEWVDYLEKLGYLNYYFRLKADRFGIPQIRERLFMISVLVPEDINKTRSELKAEINTYFAFHDLMNDDYVNTLKLSKKSFEETMRFDYSNPDYKAEADSVRLPNTDSRIKIVKQSPHLLDYRENGDLVCAKTINTITTRQDRNTSSGVIAYGERNDDYLEYRYLTPRECFLAMGFDEADYNMLVDNNIDVTSRKKAFSKQKLEKMAGNSIVVNVLEALFIQIYEVKQLIDNSSRGDS